MYLNNLQSFIYSILIFIAIGFIACEKSYDDKIILNYGEVANLEKTGSIWFGTDSISGVKITINTISDSRCPNDKDIACVWAGEAVVSVTASHQSDFKSFTLKKSPEIRISADTVSFSLKNVKYKGVLYEVNPYPKSNQNLPNKFAKLTIIKNN